jgi:hypothetical protein
MNDDRFVLIVGSPRSGTSLLRRILSSSAELCGHPLEPQYILDNPDQPGEFAEHHYQWFETQRIDRWRQSLTPSR